MSVLHRLRTPLKRAMDLVGAGVGLVVLAPVFGAVWLAVRIKLGSPVIFAQQRPGKDGRAFTMYKFRSMLDLDPVRGLVTDDQRSTTFGRRLRATSLDELPSLFNVLTGQMSLVGPRPLIMEYLPLYSPHQARRHDVRPGLTGLAQISGRNQLSWEARFDLDVEYVDRHSIMLDLTILARTVLRVFTKTGIEGDGIATMRMFVGAPPEDGLTEQEMSAQWRPLWDLWQEHPRQIHVDEPTQTQRCRYWVYLDAQDTPVGIGRLAGLGEQTLDASIRLSPDHRDSQVLHAVQNRLIHHAKSFDAAHISLPHPPGRNSSLALASETGA